MIDKRARLALLNKQAFEFTQIAAGADDAALALARHYTPKKEDLKPSDYIKNLPPPTFAPKKKRWWSSGVAKQSAFVSRLSPAPVTQGPDLNVPFFRRLLSTIGSPQKGKTPEYIDSKFVSNAFPPKERS